MPKKGDHIMPFVQFLLTIASLSALAGGTFGVERVMDRYGRIPAPTAAEAVLKTEESDEEPAESRLLY